MCRTIQDRTKYIKTILCFEQFKKKNIGRKKSSVYAYEIIDGSTKLAKDKPTNGEDFYYYSGPPAERDFCVRMLRLDKVYSKEEIDYMSDQIGFDVFSYTPGPKFPDGGPGGPNCTHSWIRFRGKEISGGSVPTIYQIDTLVNKHIFG